MSTRMLLVVAAALSSTNLHAQVLGDTVVYREVTDSRLAFQTPQGEMAADSKHDATVAFWLVRADSAVAWYDGITISVTSPMQNASPDLSSLKGQSFVLAIAPNGHISVRKTPDFPVSLKAISDLSLQFFDFFLARPQTGMRNGVTWIDTLAVTKDSAGTVGLTRKITTYRVLKDTVFAGEEAYVVSGEGAYTMETKGPVDGRPGLSMAMRFSGPETNRFVVAKSTGTLLHRDRTGRFTGEVHYVGGPQDVRMAATQSYTSTIALMAGGR